MPILNGKESFNVGRDCTLVFVGPGGQVQLDNVEDFEAKQDTAAINVDRLDGVQLNAALPKGWSGSFSIARNSGSLDDAFAAMENAWYSNGSYQVSTIYQFVLNGDGSRTTYQYDSCAVTLSDAGSWKGDAAVKQKVDFKCNRRKKV